MERNKIVKLASTLMLEIIKTDLPNDEINRLNDIVDEIREEALIIDGVVGQSEQLKALEDLKDFAYDNCQLHNSDRLAEIMERL